MAHLGKGNEEELVVGVLEPVQWVLWAVLPHPFLISLGVQEVQGPGAAVPTDLPSTQPAPALNMEAPDAPSRAPSFQTLQAVLPPRKAPPLQAALPPLGMQGLGVPPLVEDPGSGTP